jgi:hypothetical protein
MDYLVTLLTSQRCIACSFLRQVLISVSLLSIRSRNYFGLVMKRLVFLFYFFEATMQVERLGRLLIRMRRVESPLTMDLIYKSILRSVRTLLKKARSPSFCSIKPALSLWHREVYIISPEEA